VIARFSMSLFSTATSSAWRATWCSSASAPWIRSAASSAAGPVRSRCSLVNHASGDLQDLRERPDVFRLQRLGAALKFARLLQREAVRGKFAVEVRLEFAA
jgi:hypothetical protein